MFIYSEGDGDPLGVFERRSNVTICSADLPRLLCENILQGARAEARTPKELGGSCSKLARGLGSLGQCRERRWSSGYVRRSGQ